jgi:folate-dependent phosphoribosylglycinamide formyltransferase PurN
VGLEAADLVSLDFAQTIREAFAPDDQARQFPPIPEEVGADGLALDEDSARLRSTRNPQGRPGPLGPVRLGDEPAPARRDGVEVPGGVDAVGEFSKKVFDLCDDAAVDLVCLAGWLSLLQVPPKYQGRVMNIHPALLPSPFGGKGMFGPRVHQAVLAHGCKVSGCTVHFVDNDYDAGPIIIQKCCPVLEDDTPESLAHRVAELERVAYPEAIRLFAAGALVNEGRRVRVASDATSNPPHQNSA